MLLKDLLAEFKRSTHCSNEMIAKFCGVSKSTVSRWCSGEIRRIQDDTIEILSELMQMDILSLLKLHRAKPIVGVVKAGYDLYAQQNILGYEEVSAAEDALGDFFLQVQGDSMIYAHIYDGDMLYIKKCTHVESGTIAIVMIQEEATVKKVIWKDDFMILEAGNPLVENRYFTKKEIQELRVQIIGKVVFSKTYF